MCHPSDRRSALMMLSPLSFLLLGAVAVLRPALGVPSPPLTTATPVIITPAPAPAPTSSTAAPSYQLTEEPWFPYRELILECLVQMSWPCVQRKMIVYLDQLNRARSVSVLGDLLTLVKVRADNVPPITEAQLMARGIARDEASLYNLLELTADRFVDTHVLRVNVPSLEGGVLRITPLDINFVTAGDTDTAEAPLARTGRHKKGGGGDKKKAKMKKKGGKMMMKMMMAAGKKMMEMMGKMVMVKMMMMVPIAMKKGMIGGMAGLASMGMMKMMLLQKIISLIKMKIASCGGGGGGGGGGGCGGGCGGGGGGGDDCGGGGGGGYGGGGGGGGGWDRTYNTNSVQAYSQPYSQQGYSQNYNQPYVYYYRHPQEDDNDSSWSFGLWKRR